MGYIKRDMEDLVLSLSEQFKVILITGPRQVGKTTMLEKLMWGTGRKYVSLDDLTVRNTAKTDPEGFIKTYSPPVFIDEIQYAPELFGYIKVVVDENKTPGDYWLSGSQIFRLMRGVRESLAGRVCLLDLFPLSQNEIYNHLPPRPFELDFEKLKERSEKAVPAAPQEIYGRIWSGGMPALISGEISNRDRFYESYIGTYLERDVRDLSGDIDVLKFYRFLISAAARAGQLLNYKSIADDAEIDQATAKNWLNILEALGLIFYLHPYSNNLLKRMIKSPKLYFYDCGFVAYLTRWNSVETLMNGAQNGAVLENFVISELMKSSYNAGRRPDLYYYRDKDDKEIDIVYEANGTLYPMEVKKTSTPDIRLANVFNVLDKTDKQRGPGGILCLKDTFLPMDRQTFIIPIGMI